MNSWGFLISKRLPTNPLFLLVALASVLISLPAPTNSFTVPISGSRDPAASFVRQVSTVRYVSNVNDPPTSIAVGNNSDDNDMDDEALLNSTPKKYFVSLCQQLGISDKGTKEDLLLRLREYATKEAEKEKERLLARKQRVEEGGDDSREKFETLGDEDDEDDDEEKHAVFYYYDSSVNVTTTSNEQDEPKFENQPTNQQGYAAVPPPPPVEPDENGERVVTTYSTSDMNDLTGVAASQPGQSSFDPMTSTIGQPENAPWDSINAEKKAISTSEVEKAEEEVTELVKVLLGTTGLEAFQQDDDDEIDDHLSLLGVVRRRTPSGAPMEIKDFNPSLVPTDMLSKASRSLRTSRGKVLQDVMRKFELKAIGHDGASGDNASRGGGHYKQVSRVRSFLEGFRQAEVRRISRQTTTLLLDRLVTEGIEGLDIALASMVRSEDDTSDEGGELNDSLLEYLNDAIRQQEKKVGQVADTTKRVAAMEIAVKEADEDQLDKLWTVDSDGVETFDPSTPENKKILREEFEKEAAGTLAMPDPILPQSAPEKILLLLKLLRERVKIEAAFEQDEKVRNLRVLAYALNLKTDDARRDLLLREFGGSLDKLDSFAELVASSVEYGESTSHQLQPSQRGPLNVKLLKHIYDLTQEIWRAQSYKASGTGTRNKKLSP